tara:strand:+ start:3474 stop:4100 length:627 start_codon:yes stop_codon:yes gene_type:complete
MNRFISFEGIDGCGKTTQINLLSKYLDSIDQDNVIVREPGGTKVSEKIRKILLDNNNHISNETETLLFLSARSQLTNEIISKNIKENKFTICDRYTDSTLAYQGYGRELDLKKIKLLNDFATSNIKPDLTFILDVELSDSIKRIGKNRDRMEESGLDFLRKVSLGYQKIFSENDKRFRLINCGTRSISSINEEIVDIINVFYKGVINE